MNNNIDFVSALEKSRARNSGFQLGSFTKNYSTSSNVVGASGALTVPDRRTGEIFQMSVNSSGDVHVEKNVNSARVTAVRLKTAVDQIIPKSRTAKSCMVCQAPDFNARQSGDASKNQDIQIRKNSETGVAHFSGLMMCGSVWNCPVCNRSISSHRRDELKQALESAKNLGWKTHLVTLTVPHGIGDDLLHINNLQRLALNKISQGRNSISQSLKRLGFTLHGYIRAKEVTYGRNGFHPHYHIIVFSDASTDVLRSVYSRWCDACQKVGLPRPCDRFGVDVRSGDENLSAYVAKWGLEFEMTTGHSKISRKGLSPYQLLSAYLDGGYSSDYLNLSKEMCAGLFINFADSMKGQRQLHWSVGLREKLGLSQSLTDEEILQNQNEKTELVVTVSPKTYKSIRYLRAWNAVLSIAETNPELLLPYFSHLNDLYDKKIALYYSDKRYKTRRKNL